MMEAVELDDFGRGKHSASPAADPEEELDVREEAAEQLEEDGAVAARGALEEVPKLSLVTKIGYGLCECGLFIASALQGFFLSTFFLEVAQIMPVLAGVAVLCGQVYDSFSDPIAGRLSDGTKSRWGRRRPWLLFASVPLAVIFFMVWLVPPIDSQIVKMAYYIVIIILFKTAYTSIAVPYSALTPDLTEDYNERTSLTMFRMIFGMLGSLVAVVAHSVVIAVLATETEDGARDFRLGYMVSGFIWAIVVCICTLSTFFMVRERFVGLTSAERKARALEDEGMYENLSRFAILRNGLIDFFVGISEAFRIKAFALVTATYVLAWVAINFTQTNLVFYIKFVYKGESQLAIIVLALQLVTILSLPGWFFVSKKIGKKRTYYIGGAMYAVPMTSFLVMGAGQWPFMVAVILFGGAATGCALLLPWSMLPDVVEIDELKKEGLRREGLFYSFFVFFQKVGLGLGIAVSAIVLGLTGFMNPEELNAAGKDSDYQPPAVIWALRLACGPISGSLIFLSVVMVWLFPITRTKHKETTAKVLALREQQAQKEADREQRRKEERQRHLRQEEEFVRQQEAARASRIGIPAAEQEERRALARAEARRRELERVELQQEQERARERRAREEAAALAPRPDAVPDGPEDVADRHEDAADRHEDAEDRHEDAEDRHEDVADRREDVADRREDVAEDADDVVADGVVDRDDVAHLDGRQEGRGLLDVEEAGQDAEAFAAVPLAGEGADGEEEEDEVDAAFAAAYAPVSSLPAQEEAGGEETSPPLPDSPHTFHIPLAEEEEEESGGREEEEEGEVEEDEVDAAFAASHPSVLSEADAVPAAFAEEEEPARDEAAAAEPEDPIAAALSFLEEEEDQDLEEDEDIVEDDVGHIGVEDEATDATQHPDEDDDAA